MKALILGGANTLAEDRAAALELFEPDVVIAVNNAGRDEPGYFDHWVSFHAELFERWITERRAAGRPDPGQLWTGVRRLPPFDFTLRRVANWGGSSGLLAVTVALELSCERIVLAGVPLTREGAHYDDPKPWGDAGNYRRAWISKAAEMGGRVRSMSGWTQDLLGAPDKEWLDGAGRIPEGRKARAGGRDQPAGSASRPAGKGRPRGIRRLPSGCTLG